MDVNAAITGNLAADARLSHTQDGTPVAELRVLVNRRQRTEAGQWTDLPPRPYTVVAYGALAANVAESVRKGDRVTVLADDMYADAWSHRQTGEPMAAVKVRATDIALAMRFATAAATRVRSAPASGDDGPGTQQPVPALAVVPGDGS